MTSLGSDPQLVDSPVVKTGMFVRRPVDDVFNAFIDPAVTSQFWFTKGSGRLQPGVTVQWDWEMFGASVAVVVLAVEQDSRISIEWGGPETPTIVDWHFAAMDGDTTFVTITNSGFIGREDECCREALDATEGFVLVLAGLKAYLEHDLKLNLVGDRFPGGIDDQ